LTHTRPGHPVQQREAPSSRYRVMYEIKGDVVSIWHIARRETSG
jgi:hypothetical protein